MPNTNRGNTTPTGPLVRTAHPNNKGMNMGSPFSSNLSSHRYSVGLWQDPIARLEHGDRYGRFPGFPFGGEVAEADPR